MLKVIGYGIAAVGAIGGYSNYRKLQADVGESNAVRALLKLDPTGLVANQPNVVAQSHQLDSDVAADKNALFIDAGLLAIGLWIAHKD
jgi:hypothetical protein